MRLSESIESEAYVEVARCRYGHEIFFYPFQISALNEACLDSSFGEIIVDLSVFCCANILLLSSSLFYPVYVNSFG